MLTSTSHSHDGRTGGVKTKKLVGNRPVLAADRRQLRIVQGVRQQDARADRDQRRGNVDRDLEQVVRDQERDQGQQQGVPFEFAEVSAE